MELLFKVFKNGQFKSDLWKGGCVLRNMAATQRLLIAILIISSCYGYFSPDLKVSESNLRTKRSKTDQLTPRAVTGIENIFNIVKFALSIGVGNGRLPRIINEKDVNSPDSIINDYNKGLDNEDVNLDIDELIVKYGHPVEKHQVLTEDGYNLTMFRIPGNGSVVFMMHGLLGSADDYIIAGPETGLAYLLANQGYDIWLGNSRGNKHSRRHVKLKPSQKEFWNFGWHEIGYYDIPAMIDYTLEATGQDKLKYIGHSQGTTSFWVMGSERPDYNDKIALMVALAPSAFVTHMKAPLVRLVAPFHKLLYSVSKTFGIYEIGADSKVTKFLSGLVCGSGPLSEILCANILFLSSGFDLPQLNITNIPVINSHLPSGASTIQALHYAQNVVTKRFMKFDYGISENLKRYGSRIPSDYKLNKVRAPVALAYSDGDWMVNPKDVDQLTNKLPNVVDKHKIKYKNFNHFDYLTAKDLKSLLFEWLSEIMSKY